jgi:hypothetical protein
VTNISRPQAKPSCLSRSPAASRTASTSSVSSTLPSTAPAASAVPVSLHSLPSTPLSQKPFGNTRGTTPRTRPSTLPTCPPIKPPPTYQPNNTTPKHQLTYLPSNRDLPLLRPDLRHRRHWLHQHWLAGLVPRRLQGDGPRHPLPAVLAHAHQLRQPRPEGRFVLDWVRRVVVMIGKR